MKLELAARYFDRLPVYDAYTNAELFKGQFDLFDDSKRDAVNVQRRTMSVVPAVSMPARLAVKAANQFWVVGNISHGDTFMASILRAKYTLHRAAGLAKLRTPGQVIADAGGSTAYAGLAWMKDWKEGEHSSKVFAYYEVYFSIAEAVVEGTFLELDGKVFRVRGVYTSESGFRVAESDDLGAARVSVTFSGPGTYDPTTDTLTSTPAAVAALLVRYAADYEYETQASVKRQEGDQVFLVRKATVPAVKAGDTLTHAGRVYRVISVSSESDCWNLTGRP